MKWRAAITSAALSVLFVVVYGGCNQLTALRGDVGTFYFAWERWIPFVPAMIVPYMSIDLFFVIAPFLCGDRKELATYRKRIVLCIFVAGACFLLFPLRFTFARPALEGVLGMVMQTFWKMDLPFNEFPSLHIALRGVMVGVYVRHTRGWVRWALHIWFSLIGFSTVLVYQHHVIDVLGGFVLAGAAYCVFQEREESRAGDRRVGMYYAMGAGMLVAAAWWWRPAGIVVLWPAMSLAVVAAGYLGVGVRIYRKREGRVGRWAWLVMWPVLLGHWVSWWWYARRSAAWDRLTERVWIGRQLRQGEARRAVAEGVTAVVDLTGEFTEARAFRGVRYLSVPLLDLTAPAAGQVREVVKFIEEESRAGVVYVHCKAGYSRTAAVAGAYLIHSGQARTAEEAAELLRKTRPGIIIRPEAMATIRASAIRMGEEAAT